MSEISFDELKSRYQKRVEQELGVEFKRTKPHFSKEYNEFRKEIIPTHMNFYEKACNFCENLFKIQPSKEKEAALIESISVSHLNITPAGATSFSLLAPMSVILIGILFGIAVNQMFFVFIFLFVGLILIKPFSELPQFIANSWRLKASNQMVLCIFYVVTYMRHTSNLEGGIEFAADHLSAPLSLDLKKVLWNVETEEYENVKESLDSYLKTWKKWNYEFIEAFHLVESSLYEGDEEKRVEALDRALDIILSETYEKMLHFAHNLQSPITMLHMIGIILPILSLVILPMVVSFLGDVKWYYLAVFYDVLLPIAVFYMGKIILSTRPSGYGESDISEDFPQLKKYKNAVIKVGNNEIQIDAKFIGVSIFIVLFIIGISPFILNILNPNFDMGWGKTDATSPCLKQNCLLAFERNSEGRVVDGPFGLGASLLSFCVVLSFGFGIGTFYKLKSKNVIKIRDKSKKLEKEFAGSLFQLGNRLGDGIPVEMAIPKVAEAMEGTTSGNFFKVVSNNVRRLGMSVQNAIFDKKYGALAYFPSNIIEGSMKVLVESAKKGPKVAGFALMNVSRYIKEIHKVNERLKDLMADIVSSMTSQIKFLTPLIAGIVIGISSMISNILRKLSEQAAQMSSADAGMAGMAGGALFGRGIPTYYFQLIVGIYVVEIVFILTIMSNSIKNGADKLNERFELGNNLPKSTLLYCTVAAIVMVIFNYIASNILGGMISIN